MSALEKQLCKLEHEGFINQRFKEYRKLVRHPEFICTSCGRAARRKVNLCEPKRLYPKDKKQK